jgi:hypothetical protein
MIERVDHLATAGRGLGYVWKRGSEMPISSRDEEKAILLWSSRTI